VINLPGALVPSIGEDSVPVAKHPAARARRANTSLRLEKPAFSVPAVRREVLGIACKAGESTQTPEAARRTRETSTAIGVSIVMRLPKPGRVRPVSQPNGSMSRLVPDA